MWIFTGYGAYFPSQRPADTMAEGETHTIQIRTRRKIELERLKAFYPEIPTGDIVFFPHTDYEYRMYCTPTALGMLLALMAADIDYTKFKPTTEIYGESKLHAAYNRIWAVLYDTFSTNRYLDQRRIPSQSRNRPNPSRRKARKAAEQRREDNQQSVYDVVSIRRGGDYNWDEGTWE